MDKIGAPSLIATRIFEKPSAQALFAAWLPIAYAGVFSSAIGYTFQIIGQKYADPPDASTVISFESEFAALAGCILFKRAFAAHLCKKYVS